MWADAGLSHLPLSHNVICPFYSDLAILHPEQEWVLWARLLLITELVQLSQTTQSLDLIRWEGNAWWYKGLLKRKPDNLCFIRYKQPMLLGSPRQFSKETVIDWLKRYYAWISCVLAVNVLGQRCLHKRDSFNLKSMYWCFHSIYWCFLYLEIWVWRKSSWKERRGKDS